MMEKVKEERSPMKKNISNWYAADLDCISRSFFWALRLMLPTIKVTTAATITNTMTTFDNIQAVWVGDIDANVLTQSDGYTSGSDFEITERAWYKAVEEEEDLFGEMQGVTYQTQITNNIT